MRTLFLSVSLALWACTPVGPYPPPDAADDSAAERIAEAHGDPLRTSTPFVVNAPLRTVDALPALPLALANNAVAAVRDGEDLWLVSLLGLGAGKTHADVSAAGFLLRLGETAWQPLDAVPGPPRLAASAVGLGGRLYLFGGYTVAADGSEKSVPAVHALAPRTRRWDALPPMPVPVDDAVSVAYAGRYIYLVSGWHDSGNVNLVQVLDTHERRWFQATPYPGAPVFGHAGGIAGSTMVICDGVKVVATTGRRRFEPAAACFRGAIDAADPARIDWTVIRHHPGPALYRMAASGDDDAGRVVFAGGSDNPYNFDGIGYDDRPSAASARVFWFDLGRNAWVTAGRLPQASMDHRGLLQIGPRRYAIVGGMHDHQQVSAATQVFELP